MNDLILLDLFSGIGGFPLGLYQAGFRFKEHYFSEIDKYAISNYQYNFKKAKYVGAVEEIKKGKLPKPDIITFGSPCQDLSLAGKRKGLKGDKSKLFFEAVRILGEFKPRLFIFENVKGLFSSNQGKDFEIVLRSFADLGLYDLQWQLLNTAWFLPQNRERVYIVGSLRGKPRPQTFPLREIYQTDFESSKKVQKRVISPAVTAKVGSQPKYGPYVFSLRGGGGRKRKGQNVEFRKDQATNCITSANKHNFLLGNWYPMRSVRTEKAKAIRRENQKLGIDYAPFNEREFEVRVNGLVGTIMKRGERENLLTNMKDVRRLTPLECERLQGFPDGWTNHGIVEGKQEEISDNQRYQLLGNAVSVPVVRAVGKNILPMFNGIKKGISAPLEGLDFIKTPFTYYGGKQRMVRLILSLIPKHKLYCEPFVGGAAVFFAKDPSEMEVINDLNGDVVNFYKACHNDFKKLSKLIQETPHSRELHREAKDVLKNQTKHNATKRAWAFWVQTNMSFSSKVFGGYAYERNSNGTVKRFVNKKLAFDESLKARFDMVDIENNDALKVIQSRDDKESFFYCDPPYFNSNMGHYGGYTEKDFEELLQTLSKIKGRFLLSSYPSDILNRFIKKRNLHTFTKSSGVSVTKHTNKIKTEVLTANYPLKLDKSLDGFEELPSFLEPTMLRLRLKLLHKD